MRPDNESSRPDRAGLRNSSLSVFLRSPDVPLITWTLLPEIRGSFWSEERGRVTVLHAGRATEEKEEEVISL